MYRIRHIAYAFMAASLLTACMQYESEMLSDGTLPLTLTASIEGSTATRATVDNTWDGGEVIALQVNGGDWYDYTADASGNLTGNYYWKNNNSITVQGIYPATVVENTNWSVEADQSSDVSYQSGDLLASNIQTVSYGGTADLEFYHQTAKVVVNVKNADLSDAISAAAEDINVIIGEEDDLVLEAGFSFPTAADVGGRWRGTWDPGTEKGSVTPHLSETAADGCLATYSALVIPQIITSGTRLLTFKVTKDGTEYGPFYYTLPSEIEWKAGYVYTYNVSIFFYGVDVSVSTGMVWNEGESIEVELDVEVAYTYDAETNAYTVYTADGLLEWNKAVQDDLSMNCTLAADIDLTGIDYEWLLVGNTSNQYTGTFEGGNHTIRGLTVNQKETDYVGLIGCLGSDGKVQNLTLENMSIIGYNYVGGVVGENTGTVNDCSASGDVTGGGYYVGSVVGYNTGTVTGCSSSGSVSGDRNVGGVVGYNYGTVTGCYHASGDVTGNNDYVGGVVGYNSGGTVTGCYHATGSVSGSGNYVGGVVGGNLLGTVTDCSASGDVTGNGDYVGGVVGENTGSVNDCSASGSVSGDRYVGGVVGWNYDTGTVTGCYHVSGDVTGNGDYVGGVVGENTGSVNDCSASGDVTGGGYYVGGVVGENTGNVTGCSSSGSVSGDRYVGGVVGRNNAGSVTDCYNASGDVTGGGYYVGGVVGYNAGIVTDCSASGGVSGPSYVGGVVGGNAGTVTDCYHDSGSVSASNTSYSYVGGVVGYNIGTITACYASGSVSGSGYVGGVVGWNYNGGTVTDCSASGSVSASNTSYSYVGGVVGVNFYGTVIACYASGSVSGNGNYVGGVVGLNYYGSVIACYHASGSVSGSEYVGGVVGWTYYGTVTACYWSDYTGNGINGGSGEATEVDGTDVTWEMAVDGMNAAIDTWNSENSDSQCYWHYELTGDLPTLTKNDE